MTDCDLTKGTTRAAQAPASRTSMAEEGSRTMEAVSAIESVTLYEDRGEVVRRFQVAVPKGVFRVRIGGITPFADDRSLCVKSLTPTVRVVSARVLRCAVREDPPDLTSLKENCEKLIRRAVDAHRKRKLAASDLSRLKSLFETLTEALSEVPPAQSLDEWMSALEETSEALDAAVVRREEADFSLREVSVLASQAITRLRAVRRGEPVFHALIEVQAEVLPEAAGNPPSEAVFEVGYRTPCALWRPEYLARLTSLPSEGASSGEKSLLSLTRRAAVWQMTGEDWKDVRLILSTARPARPARAPLISDDKIRLRKKTPEEAKKVSVVVREQKIGRLSGGSADELPGVDDGGEVRCFVVPLPVSLPSDGLAHHVDIGTLELSAEVCLISCPEISEGVHMKAVSRLPAGEMPLLAGPVQLAREGGYVGRMQIGYIAPGDEIALGFGAEDAIRVRRSVAEKRQAATLTSRRSVTRTVTLKLSNLSDTPRRFRVEERVPVSEIDGVDVSVDEKGAFSGPDKDGLLKAEISLPANGNSTLVLKYTVSASSRVELTL